MGKRTSDGPDELFRLSRRKQSLIRHRVALRLNDTWECLAVLFTVIAAIIAVEKGGGLFGERGSMVVGLVLVFVGLIASIVIRRNRIRQNLAIELPGHCRTCGYNLTASGDRCSECGTPVPGRRLPDPEEIRVAREREAYQSALASRRRGWFFLCVPIGLALLWFGPPSLRATAASRFLLNMTFAVFVPLLLVSIVAPRPIARWVRMRAFAFQVFWFCTFLSTGLRLLIQEAIHAQSRVQAAALWIVCLPFLAFTLFLLGGGVRYLIIGDPYGNEPIDLPTPHTSATIAGQEVRETA